MKAEIIKIEKAFGKYQKATYLFNDTQNKDKMHHVYFAGEKLKDITIIENIKKHYDYLHLSNLKINLNIKNNLNIK